MALACETHGSALALLKRRLKDFGQGYWNRGARMREFLRDAIGGCASKSKVGVQQATSQGMLPLHGSQLTLLGDPLFGPARDAIRSSVERGESAEGHPKCCDREKARSYGQVQNPERGVNPLRTGMMSLLVHGDLLLPLRRVKSEMLFWHSVPGAGVTPEAGSPSPR